MTPVRRLRRNDRTASRPCMSGDPRARSTPTRQTRCAAHTSRAREDPVLLRPRRVRVITAVCVPCSCQHHLARPHRVCARQQLFDQISEIRRDVELGRFTSGFHETHRPDAAPRVMQVPSVPPGVSSRPTATLCALDVLRATLGVSPAKVVARNAQRATPSGRAPVLYSGGLPAGGCSACLCRTAGWPF